MNPRTKLDSLQKGSMTNVYFSKMKTIRDEITSASKLIDDEDIVLYILMAWTLIMTMCLAN